MLSSDAEVLFPGTEVEKVADTMIEAKIYTSASHAFYY
jgi:hypothetical protein